MSISTKKFVRDIYKIKNTALYKATITKTERLAGGGTIAINDAFLRVYGIDLTANFASSLGYMSVEEVREINT